MAESTVETENAEGGFKKFGASGAEGENAKNGDKDFGLHGLVDSTFKIPKGKAKKKLSLFLSTFISVFVTILTAWVQTHLNDQMMLKLENEKEKRIISKLTEIVERDVVDNKIVDHLRITRNIETLKQEERITTDIDTMGIIKRAELNISDNRYILASQREGYLKILESTLAVLYKQKMEYFKHAPFGKRIDALVECINEGQSEKALNVLETLVVSYDEEIARLNKLIDSRDTRPLDFFRLFREKPYFIYGYAVALVALILGFNYLIGSALFKRQRIV